MVWDVITTLSDNLYMSFENIVTLIVFMGFLIPYAKDYLLGVVLHFLAFTSLFMAFYYHEMNYTNPAILSLIFLVLMCISLYAQHVSQTSPITGVT